jgi:TonB family protein
MQLLKTLVIIFISSMIVLSVSIFGQSSEVKDEYLAFAEKMPEPQGGLVNLIKQISYPEVAKKVNIEGKVYAMAYVNETGGVDQVKIIKGLGGGCDEEVERVLSSAKFIPGEQEGKKVKVKTSLSFAFKLKK